MNTKIKYEKTDGVVTACIFVDGEFVFFDLDEMEYINSFVWHIKSGLHYKYAYREYIQDGKTQRVYMHRELSACPKNKVCHHINYCGLDNRKKNLQNMSKKEHVCFHNRSTRPKKFPKSPPRAGKKEKPAKGVYSSK